MRGFGYETNTSFDTAAESYDTGDWGDTDTAEAGGEDWGDIEHEPTLVTSDDFGQKVDGGHGLPTDIEPSDSVGPPVERAGTLTSLDTPDSLPAGTASHEIDRSSDPARGPLLALPGESEPAETDHEAVTGVGDTAGADVSNHLTPPPGFEYNPDVLDEDYDDQVRVAFAEAAYQAEPVPSFEDVPTLDITPTFNPTGAPDSEIFASNRMPRSLRPTMAPRSEWRDDDQPVEMWRIVDRAKLVDGTGLVASRILHGNDLGDVEGFRPARHLASTDERRRANENTTTPLVCFSTDPVDLAKNAILRNGFGIRGGRDSVVVRVEVDPGRVISGPRPKNPQVLLLGGVAPTEYKATYNVADFISHLVADGPVTTIRGVMHRDEALNYWAQQS